MLELYILYLGTCPQDTPVYTVPCTINRHFSSPCSLEQYPLFPYYRCRLLGFFQPGEFEITNKKQRYI